MIMGGHIWEADTETLENRKVRPRLRSLTDAFFRDIPIQPAAALAQAALHTRPKLNRPDAST